LFDGAKLVQRILVGVTPLLEFADGDKLFGANIPNRYCRDPATGYLLDRRLDVIGIVVASIHDQEALDAADDE